MLRKLYYFLIILVFSFLSFPVIATSAKLQKVNVVETQQSTKIQFDFSARPQYNIKLLAFPRRIVIDFKNTNLQTILPAILDSTSLIKKIISVSNKANTLRLRIDLARKVRYKMIWGTPTKNYHYTILLFSKISKPKNKPISPAISVVKEKVETLPSLAFSSSTAKLSKPILVAKKDKLHDLIIVLDPGHGGKDSGARGRLGTQEKNVVLSISRYLRKDLQSVPGIKVYMTRDSDYYISLRRRLDIARQDKADIFIALHADAYRNSNARGASIFALSQRGATSEGARWLAEKENESEMLGGASLNDKDYLLRSVLIDMSQTATINMSLDLGTSILSQLRLLTPLHANHMEQAAFVVLKSPDIPSILIENGFISNPQEEKKLRDSDYQQQLAEKIKDGIVAYFKQKKPFNTVFSQNYRK